MILFLDLSKNAVGWAVDGLIGNGIPPRVGTWRPPMPEIKRGPLGHAFQQWLYRFIQTNGVGMVCYEAPIVASSTPKEGSKARKIQHNFNHHMILFGLAFSAETIAAANKIPCNAVAAQTVRKLFVGHGRPENPKQVVREKCAALGWRASNDDEGDAIAGWAWAKAEYDDNFIWKHGKPLILSREGNG